MTDGLKPTPPPAPPPAWMDERALLIARQFIPADGAVGTQRLAQLQCAIVAAMQDAAAPQAAQPLTERQIAECMEAVDEPHLWGRFGWNQGGSMVTQFVRIVERRHGIGAAPQVEPAPDDEIELPEWLKAAPAAQPQGCGYPYCGGTAPECKTCKTCKNQRAAPAAQPADDEGYSPFPILDVWRTALTLANNLCVQISDRHNGDDETREADAASECATSVRRWLDPGDELWQMLAEAGHLKGVQRMLAAAARGDAPPAAQRSAQALIGWIVAARSFRRAA